MLDVSMQDIFELKCLVKNIDVHLSARLENGVKQLLALVTGEGDILLHYTYGELPPIVKRLAWFTDSKKTIQAICFDPTATWLLAVTIDGTLVIIPALSLVDKKQKVDCKWALNDVTQFPRHPQTPNAKPSTVVWWQTLDCNQNALVAYENGEIALISLTDGRCLGNTAVAESVTALQLCQDNTLDVICLLINGASGQQYRLLLEQHSIGYVWPPDTSTSDDSSRSRLQSLKQLGVDKLASLKQRFTEGRGQRRDSQTSGDSASEGSNSESTHSGPEMLPHLCDMFFSPQYARNRYLFSAFYKPTSIATVHSVDPDTAPLYIYKLPPRLNSIMLTDHLIYAINEDLNILSIISTQYAECNFEGETEYNPLASVAEFGLQNKDEKILAIYKQSNLAGFKEKRPKDDPKDAKTYTLPKTIDDLDVQRPRIDTCVLITNLAVYKVAVKTCPVTKFITEVTENNNLELAQRLSQVFSLNLQQLLECCGDILVANGSFHSGLILYKQAKVHLLKRVLKVAISADCKSLLKFVNLCLNAGKVDMSMATKIHVGNLAVMAYTELILRYGGSSRVNNTREFMNFLCFEEFFDQVLAVNVACQAGIWNIITVLAKCRGLQIEVVAALCQILQTNRAPNITNEEFTLALSEPSVTSSFLIYPVYSQIILNYIRLNVDYFTVEVLKRFLVQLDPSQPNVLPFVSRLFQHNRKYSSLDSTLENSEFENPDRSVTIVKELIETFIYVLITFVKKASSLNFELSLLEKITPRDPPVERPKIKKFPNLRQLSCGYEHAAVIRNGSVYTMGISNSGCLGLGPLLTHSSPPKVVQALTDLKVKALSVSCGRKHTLVLTDFGVYCWGSNSYGQLGLGAVIQESPYPQLVTSLSHSKVVDVVAGQYHSIALTADGKVYTWGWGIHGQLGHDSCDNEYYPKELKFEEPVVQVAAGHAHSLLLTCEGKLYGFGSNAFGQLESCNGVGTKTTRPVRVYLMPDVHVPIERIATAYFHNIAVRADQQVYTWGASPQEVRMSQSKQQKQPAEDPKLPESCKASALIYSSSNGRPIEQVAVGYRHCVVLHSGTVLFTRGKGGQLLRPKMNEHDGFAGNRRFVEVSCGSDFMMALEQNGKVLAWGGPSLSQTILGRSADEDSSKRLDSKVVIFKNTKRIIRFPNASTAAQANLEPAAIEIPGLPSMAITFANADPRTFGNRRYSPYSIITLENPTFPHQKTSSKPLSRTSLLLEQLYDLPDLKFSAKTLHFVLETYYNFYDTENVLAKCLETGDFQAASKVAILDGHFSDSLGFQLAALRRHMDGHILDFGGSTEDLNEYNSKNCSPAKILSSSSSLDSIRQWGDDLEHQGGRESPCGPFEIGDVRQNVSQYVQSMKSDSSPPISSLSRMVDAKNIENKKTQDAKSKFCIADEKTKEIVGIASELVEFYTRKIYASENHILMQNVLMKCIDFWLAKNLPVAMLEDVLLKNMDKYFYPLSILLFCKNFNNNAGEEMTDVKHQSSAGFLKQFSTKFCLQLCSMVLENVNKS